GGLCVAAFGFRRMLFVAALGVALSNLAFLLMSQYPSQIWAFYAAITVDNVAQGFAGTVLVAFMSSLTDRNFTATQFALLVSLAPTRAWLAGLWPGIREAGADPARCGRPATRMRRRFVAVFAPPPTEPPRPCPTWCCATSTRSWPSASSASPRPAAGRCGKP